jgi:hypothetical protein
LVALVDGFASDLIEANVFVGVASNFQGAQRALRLSQIGSLARFASWMRSMKRGVGVNKDSDSERESRRVSRKLCSTIPTLASMSTVLLSVLEKFSTKAA